MLKEKDIRLIEHLRKNSRKSLAKISKETNIPISTLFDTLKKLESSVIKKHVSLLDFEKLGYSMKVNFSLKSQQKQELKKHLMQHPNINSIFSLINGYDFYVECIFRDLKQVIEFKEQLEKFNIEKLEETFIIEEVKKEGFNLVPNHS